MPRPGASAAVRSPRPALAWVVGLVPLCGCGGEVAMLLSLMAIAGVSAIAVVRGHRRHALMAAVELRAAIAAGRQREVEMGLRKQLALAAAGEAVSEERQWLARTRLGGLLVAEWRLDEAREVYGVERRDLSPHFAAIADFGRHELAALTEPVDAARLAAVRADRDRCLALVPARLRGMVADTWHALEGLCLVRMGREREAVPLLEDGIDALAFNPAQVIYLFHLALAYERTGEPALARAGYERASAAYPGSRLASDAAARRLALDAGSDGLFRGMLPEAPLAAAQSVPSAGARDASGAEEEAQTDPFAPNAR